MKTKTKLKNLSIILAWIVFSACLGSFIVAGVESFVHARCTESTHNH